MPDGPREMRLVVTAPDYDAALHFYRDVLGLREQATFTDDNGGRATLMHAGRATLELGDEAHADAIDALEVGRRVAGPVRLAFEVADARTMTDALAAAGAELVAGPVGTPWGSVNARLNGPDRQQLTVYANDHYLVDRPVLAGQVELAEPDPAWASTAATLVRDIRSALGEVAPVVAHAGSTSIPGLAAKPVIDLLVGVLDPVAEATYVPALQSLGYQLHIREPEWHEHRLLKRTDPAVNLHVFAAGSEEISRMLAFRDHLRRDDRDRNFYLRAKRELAARSWTYVQDYADAKSDVVEEILSRAVASPAPLRGCFVVLSRTSQPDGRFAASVAAELGLPLLDADRLAGLTSSVDDALLALAADTGGAVLRIDSVASATGLPGQVVDVASLPHRTDPVLLARLVRQVAAAGS